MGLEGASGGSNNNSGPRESIIFLVPTGKLKEANIVTKFVVKPTNSKKGTSGFIELELNHKYERKTIITDVYDDAWVKTIKLFTDRTKQKGVSKEHMTLLSDLLDDNAAKIIDIFGATRDNETNRANELLLRQKDQAVATALDFVEKQTVKLFLNEVNTPYIAIKVKNHTETMPLISQTFEDWLAAAFYNHQKQIAKEEAKKYCDEHSSNINTARVLSSDDIKKVQTILRFEANNADEVIKLNSRVASFIDEDDPGESRIYYDLCDKDWGIVRITPHEWGVERNYPKILFKRHKINKPQVLPNKDYPKDKNYLEEFMKLTNVYDDPNNRVLAEVYIVSLFLLADLPKPVMMPHGTHGSGKSTFQELIKQIVDPSAAPTTAFPNSLAELTQELDHSYLTFFDNVSEISQLTSDTLCRVVTGNGLTKRALFTDDEDFIYNMTRAVGFNGINITAKRADLLDRLLNLHLYPIDKRQRKKLKTIRQEFDAMLPNLLGYIFDILVKVLTRIGEVKLEGLPRMADFAEMGELIARCLGYEHNVFIDAYTTNIQFTNQEAIDSSPVATAIINLMNIHAVWSGKAEKLRTELVRIVTSNEDLQGLLNSKGWPRSPQSLRSRLNEITPNLKEIGIVVHFEYDKHTKSDTITLANNNFKLEADKTTMDESKFWDTVDSKSTDNIINHDKLLAGLTRTGFTTEQAEQLITNALTSGKLLIISVDTYRRAMKSL
jgi:hypothetical protein